MKKRTRVTIVTRQTVIAHATRLRCQQCGAEVPIVSRESAAGVLQATPQEIHGLLASGDLHPVDDHRALKLSAVTRSRPHQPKLKLKSKEKDNEASKF